MFNVTFKATWTEKQGRKTIKKESIFVEQIKDEFSAKLRACALNWIIIKMEAV